MAFLDLAVPARWPELAHRSQVTISPEHRLVEDSR
jgi:hypothetical protein